MNTLSHLMWKYGEKATCGQGWAWRWERSLSSAQPCVKGICLHPSGSAGDGERAGQDLNSHSQACASHCVGTSLSLCRSGLWLRSQSILLSLVCLPRSLNPVNSPSTTGALHVWKDAAFGESVCHPQELPNSPGIAHTGVNSWGPVGGAQDQPWKGSLSSPACTSRTFSTRRWLGPTRPWPGSGTCVETGCSLRCTPRST